MRACRWNTTVQCAPLEGADAETHALFLIGKQRLALESRLSRSFDQQRVNEQINEHFEPVAGTLALGPFSRSSRDSRFGYRRIGR